MSGRGVRFFVKIIKGIDLLYFEEEKCLKTNHNLSNVRFTFHYPGNFL